MTPSPSLWEIFLVSLRLGCTSFGGPVAHLAFFRQEYVVKRGWLDEAHYADLVALSQFLPGPASSQTGFGIGYLQRGLPGGLVAWLGFTLPSALLMIGFAYGVTSFHNLESAGWLNGLKVAAVAVVAQAVWAMWRNLCPDWPRRVLALGIAGLMLISPWAWTQVAVIIMGALIGWQWLRTSHGKGAVRPAGPSQGRSQTAGVPAPAPSVNTSLLLIFVILLFGLPVLAHTTGSSWLSGFDRFYRTGSLVFGGGHVVLPLLESEVVTPGWVTHDQFLAGYGVVQAMPGPLFTFSAYLGTVMTVDPGGPFDQLTVGWLGGLLALGAIFLPALLLVAGALPFWNRLRQQPGAQAAMRGTNASVVGLLLAALYHPVGTAGITDGRSLGLAVAAFSALQFGRIPTWALVVAASMVGMAWL